MLGAWWACGTKNKEAYVVIVPDAPGKQQCSSENGDYFGHHLTW